MELISLSDGDSSFRVRVLGRRWPGVLHLHDWLDAEVLVTSSFVSGQLAMSLLPSDLEDWSDALVRLAAGQDICWRDDGHSPEIRAQWRCRPSSSAGGIGVLSPAGSLTRGTSDDGPSAARCRYSFARPREKGRAYSGLKEHERRE